MTAVIFDIGNVVIRWRPEAAIGHLFADRAEMDRVLAEIGFGDWNKAQDAGRPWADGVAAGAAAHPHRAAVFQAYFDGLRIAHEAPIPETVTLVERLSGAGVPLHALTNASAETVEIVKEVHPVMAHFGEVVSSSEVGVLKPDPAIYHALLARTGLSAADCVFIDDSLNNVEGARAVGMDAIHFTDAANLSAAMAARGFPG